MAKVTLNDLSKALGLNEKEPKKDFHYYGTIVSSNPEDRTYEVSINRDQNISVEAARLVGAAVGDTVMVTVMANGYATVTGRLGGDLDATDAQRAADDAADVASSAMGTATTAMGNAAEANRIANNAKTLAENAEAEAGRAKTAADNAVTEAARSASAAEESERQAKRSADAADASEASATQSAQAAASSQASASQSAQSAANSQASAARSEQSAQESATSAANSAASASRSTIYANAALNQLGIVEDVAGTLDWIAKHGTYTKTTDTAVDSSKVYFVYDSSTGDYTPVIDPKASELNTYYELDITESQGDFIMSHLAVTSRGLWVLPNGIGSASDPKDAPKYKALLAADGMWIYDDHGVMVAKYGDGISFDSTREFRIGDQNTYIRYIDSNNDGVADRIEIKAASITLGSSDLATEVSKKVGNDEVITKINLSTEGAKIQASKVEIDGTATFNAIKSNADAAYDAKGAADAVHVGGRNLIRNYNDFSKWDKEGYAKVTKQSNGYFKIESTNSNNNRYGIYQRELPIEKNTDYTLSVDVVEGYCNVGIGLADWPGNATFTAENGRNVYHFNSGTTTSDQYTWSVYINGTYDGTTSKHTLIKQIKLEKGNKATDWTPAPEDVQSEIDAKKSIHTLTATTSDKSTQSTLTYAQALNYSKNGTTGLSTYVPSVSGVSVGDTVRLAYKITDTNLKDTTVYIIGEVTGVNESGSYIQFTSHGLDTTVIDGGNILTNSITANQLKAGSVTADKIVVSDRNNYVTVTENDENSLIPNSGVTIVDGWCYKGNASSLNAWISPSLSRWAEPGDKYRVTGVAKMPAAGKVRVTIYGRNAANSTVTSCSTGLIDVAANTELTINKVATVPTQFSQCPKSNITIDFFDTSNNYAVGYFKQMRVQRMSGGSLIIDGSLQIGALTTTDQDKILNDKVVLGGRNLLKKSDQLITTSDYLTGSWYLGEDPPKEGETVTLQIKGKLADAKTSWGVYNSGASIRPFVVTKDEYDSTTGIYTHTGEWKVTSGSTTVANTYMRIYALWEDQSGTSTIEWVKLERGNKPTDWTAAPEDAQGGGKNLLYNSGIGKVGGQSVKGWRASGGTVSHVDLSSSPVSGVTGAVRITNNGSSAAQIGMAQDGFANSFIAGELYSQGAWIRGSSAFTCYLQPIWNNSNTTGNGNVFAITTDWKYYKAEGLKLLGTQQSTYSAGYFYAQNVPAGGWVEVCGMKLERGATATDWTPAPEDVASDIDDASKVATNYLSFTESGGLDVGYTGKTEHTNIKADGMRIYDSTGSTEPVASFLSTGSTIGKAVDGESRTVTSNKGMRFYKRSGSDDITLAHIGYDQGVDKSGNTDTYAPYYTFGERDPYSAIGNYSMAEGHYTAASGYNSHAEGSGSVASGNYSHAEGLITTASGYSSHAEGRNTTASGEYSHAGGYYTVAGYSWQTVIGRYNSNKSNTLFEIGNGNQNKSSNALTVDRAGNIVAAGGLTLDGNKPLIRISEEGTEGHWRFRLWSDGRYEAWYNSGKTTVTLTTSSGNGWYRNNDSYLITPPSIASTVHYVTVQAMVGYANIITSLTTANADEIRYYVSHLGSLSGVSAYITAYITGAWEQ